MKNLRKIVAILAAALMLFSVLPMSAFAAAGDVILDLNFDDGSNGNFERSVNEDGYIVFDATTGNWQNTYTTDYANSFKANTDYVVTFKAKANKDTTMNFKINDGWGADAAAFKVNVTTEWQEFEGTINMASIGWAIVMFSSDAMAADAATYYIDDVKIAEKAEELEVGAIVNGDFENGAEGWTLNSSAEVVDGALQLTNTSQWAEAAMQQIAVEVGTEYTLSWKSQRVSGNGAFLMFILKGDTSNHAATGENWMNETSGNWVENSLKFTAEEALLTLKLSAEIDNPGVILIDDITLTATPKAVVGDVLNGDFETGDNTGWETWQSTTISADAAYTGSYGANIVGNGGWGGMLNQTFDVEDGKTYEFSFWYKVNSNGFNMQFDGVQSGTRYNSAWLTTGTWTQYTKTIVVSGDSQIKINFCGGGNGISENAYIDDIKLTELKDPSDDGFIINGDFEIGEAAPWTTYSGTAVDAVAAKDGDYGLYIKNPTGGWGGTAFQDFTVEVGKTYEVTMDAKAISNGQNIQIQNGGANAASTWFTKTEWTTLTFEFTATATNVRINICGGGTGANEEIYVDNVKVKQLIDPSFDGYITNGDFETGDLYPWQRIWDSQVNATIIEGGLDSAYAVEVSAANGKVWGQLRQQIAVEPNTTYIATVWAKNSDGMSLLVKDGNDTVDIRNAGANAGDEWTLVTNVFNSGDYSSVLVGVMCNTDTASGIFDNLKVCKIVDVTTEEPTCELTGSTTYTCECGACSYSVETPAYHDNNMIYTAAKEAIDCANPGNIENWYCPGCGEYFSDAYAQNFINPWYITVTVDCVRPEGVADCANVTCETCGNEIYGYGEHDVVACQGGVCGKCGDTIEGYGCANYDTPACEDGVCYYCGGFVAGYGHENGAWAPCMEGECAYGCGLTYPATEDHNDADGDDFCDNCWTHLNHVVDPCLGGECSVCFASIAPTHGTIIHMEAVAPTCVAAGNIECWYCETCGQAWLDADCTMNTNLRAVKLPATGEHTYDDDYDADCNVCGDVREVEQPGDDIVYGDADGDGEITNLDYALLGQYIAGYDVDLVLESSDVDGDGEITNLDYALLDQYIAGYDVTLGPVEENKVFNDGELGGW